MLHRVIEWLISPHARKLARFVISGSTSMASNLGILFVLVHYGNLHYLLASIISFSLSTVVSFTMQKFWTFGDRQMGGVQYQFAWYSVIVLFSLSMNTLLMYVLVEWFSLWYLAAQALAGAVVAIISYIGYQRFVFIQTEPTTTIP